MIVEHSIRIKYPQKGVLFLEIPNFFYILSEIGISLLPLSQKESQTYPQSKGMLKENKLLSEEKATIPSLFPEDPPEALPPQPWEIRSLFPHIDDTAGEYDDVFPELPTLKRAASPKNIALREKCDSRVRREPGFFRIRRSPTPER